jgi:mannosyltransferase
VRAATEGNDLSGIETGAEEPAPVPVTAEDPGATPAEVGMGTLTGPRPRRPAAAVSSAPVRPDRVLGWLMVGVPALAGLVMGGYKIGFAPLWRDEASTKAVVGRPASQIFALLHHADAVHGAYYLVMHVAVGVLGTTAGALRLPSLVAMAFACAFTAAIACRLAVAAGAPLARFTGLCAGLVLATAPYMIRYAQEARSYAMVTMFATIATYCLLRALWDGRRWWVAYGAAVALCGLFNIFGLLILAAHGVSLAIAGGHQRATVARAAALTRGDRRRGAHSSDRSVFAPAGLTGRRVAGLPRRWLITGGVAVLVLVPLAVVAFGQRRQVAWVTRPHFQAVVALAYNSAGSWRLIAPIFALAVGGVLAELVVDRGRRALTPGVVAFPWMIAPPVLLIAVSEFHPLYDERYVEFCLPALAILVAWGIAWITRLATTTPMGQVGLAWLPSAVVILGVAALLITPDKMIRLTSARPDNLLAASTIVRQQEKPGDIIFYIPATGRIVGTAYPGPFGKLRDIALAASPAASATISGTEVSPPVLQSRFAHVTRVWTVMGFTVGGSTGAVTPTDEEKLDLIGGMKEIGQWWVGDTVLRLYAER